MTFLTDCGLRVSLNICDSFYLKILFPGKCAKEIIAYLCTNQSQVIQVTYYISLKIGNTWNICQ